VVTDLYRAAVLLESGKPAAAREFAEPADEILAESSLVGKAVAAAVLLGRICLATGDLAGAKRWSAAAVERLRRTDTAPLRFHVHALLGTVAEAEGDVHAALSALLTANSVVESVRGRLQHDELKVAFLAGKQHVYESLVGLLLRLGNNLSETLRYVERAKSWSLVDSVTRQAQPGYEASSQRFTDEKTVGSLRQKLSWLYRLLDRAESAPRGRQADADQLRSRIAECERELITALTTSHRADPDGPGSFSVYDFRAELIHELLNEHTAVLEYFTIRDALHLFVVTRRELRHIPLGQMDELRRVRRLLRLQMAKGHHFATRATCGEEAWIAVTLLHLRRLYDILIAPAERWLTPGHWAVVPHGDLHGLPFHALHDGSCYIIDQHTISYAPSASILHLCCSRDAAKSEHSLVMGVPDPSAPFIQQECEAVAELLPGARLFLGEKATAQNLRTECSDTRILHLATHGVFRADNPMFSSLRLSGSRLWTRSSA
jgi:CHAT domain-containing protein